MDSAVWMMQIVVDQHRREREADAAACRSARDGSGSDEASAPRVRRSRRWPWTNGLRRSRRQPWTDAVPAVAVAAEPEQVRDDLEPVGVGDPH